MTIFTFLRATKADGELYDSWFRSPHVREFWGDPEVNMTDFHDAMSGVSDLFNYWVGYDGDTPFSLLITTNATTDTPIHLTSHLPETGDAWTLDVLIGPVEYIGRGMAAPMIEAFMRHAKLTHPPLSRMFIDPEESNSRAIHVYEKSGFRQIATFHPPEGRFMDRLHVLLSCDFP